MLDPRLKLGYYEDHKWKQNFIRIAKETVVNIYNTKYEPSENLSNKNTNNENSDFFNHMFGKQKKGQQNEMDLYLNAS